MKVFDVMFTDEHYYIFGFPVYDELYVGKHLYPENEMYYVITSEIYAKLIALQKCDAQSLTHRCQEYADEVVIEPILKGEKKYEFIGNMKDFKCSELSAVAQAVVRWMKRTNRG